MSFVAVHSAFQDRTTIHVDTCRNAVKKPGCVVESLDSVFVEGAISHVERDAGPAHKVVVCKCAKQGAN